MEPLAKIIKVNEFLAWMANK